MNCSTRSTNGAVTLHTKIKGRFKSVDEDGNEVSEVFETTPGRMMMGELAAEVAGREL